MINIVIPISKYGSSNHNDYPHNLVEINGSPLIELVVRNFDIINSRLIFVVSKDECEKHHTDSILKIIKPDCEIRYAYGITSGAALTSLLAIDFIDNNDELIIAAGDQIINEDLNEIVDSFRSKDLDGGILTFRSVHPKWSYIETENDNVIRVQEKKVISNKATAGFFYFNKGKDFVKAAKMMILKRDNINDNYYVSQAYNQMILLGKSITYLEVANQNYFKLSNPEEIESYRKMVEKK
jgi:dTDP-glucose pyrophosphorylase